SPGPQAAVRETPARHVDQILLAGQERAATHALIRGRAMRLLVEAPRELEHDVTRDAVALPRVDEPEQRQVAQEHPPVGAEPREQAPPVEPVVTREDQV